MDTNINVKPKNITSSLTSSITSNMNSNVTSNIISLKEAPIHLSSKIQNYGVLLVLQEPNLQILQASENTGDVLGIGVEDIINCDLEQILDPYQMEKIKFWLLEGNLDFINPTKVWVRQNGDDYVVFDAIFHRNKEGFLILELEPALSQENIPFLSFYNLATMAINRLQYSRKKANFSQVIVEEVRRITEFDRVMLYKFDDHNHGSVIAEEKTQDLESYLGLKYPESDIPVPARKLFLENPIRVIPDRSHQAVGLFPKINPVSGKAIDLTHSILRSPAPCHVEYLQNMGVGASLTISLIKDQKLWGLIACHHQTPKYVSYEIRKVCEFLGRVIFGEIAAREEIEDYDYQIQLQHIHTTLIEYMSQGANFIDGLIQHQPNLLNLTNSQGSAIYYHGHFTLIGNTPPEEELTFLVEWLQDNLQDETFVTTCLPDIYPDAIGFKNMASGLLAIAFSPRNYVLWFRPEVIQTVNWGGNPQEPFSLERTDKNFRLCPRKSFQLWKQTVQLSSLPWQNVEVKAALALKKVLVNFALKQADELVELATDLTRTNTELTKLSEGICQNFQKPLNQVANSLELLTRSDQFKLDETGQELVNNTVESVGLMQNLLDDILAYSQVEKLAIAFQFTDVETALRTALNNLQIPIKETKAIITHSPLPKVMADSIQLIQLFQHLIGNAIKFRSEKPPQIHISCERLENEWLFSVEDNGIGIDPKFSDRIFMIFQRLHHKDHYEGTGMGLAICKKIVEFHGGKIWVESQLNQGSTFYFTLHHIP